MSDPSAAHEAEGPDRNIGFYVGLAVLLLGTVGVIGVVGFGGAGGGRGGDGSASLDVTLPSDGVGEATSSVTDTVPTDGGGSGATCSAAGLPLPERPDDDLPQSVGRTRSALVDAFRACDVDALRALMADDFSYGFGRVGPDDAVVAYTALELSGTPVTATAVKMLVMLEPAELADGTVVWPSASQWRDADWADVPGAELDALVEVYGQEAVGRWIEEERFDGYRLGIRDDGVWLYLLDS